jgi:formylglycine-generating enzyme required for sulfatase activity
VSLGDGVALELVLVPPGRFWMGSPAHERGRDQSEGPRRRVTLTRGFWAGVHPVTQAQWRAVTGSNPSRFRGDDRPVENVSWEDAGAFCRQLGERTGLYFRLPSEAEWEYACRGCTSTPYHGGDDLPALEQVGWCNYAAACCTATETKPVGQYRPNVFGLHDTHGNVWEWCNDWFGPYPSEDVIDPVGPDAGRAGRVVRGGSWYYAPRICRSAYRFYYWQTVRTDSHGCRVILDAG